MLAQLVSYLGNADALLSLHLLEWDQGEKVFCPRWFHYMAKSDWLHSALLSSCSLYDPRLSGIIQWRNLSNGAKAAASQAEQWLWRGVKKCMNKWKAVGFLWTFLCDWPPPASPRQPFQMATCTVTIKPNENLASSIPNLLVLRRNSIWNGCEGFCTSVVLTFH